MNNQIIQQYQNEIAEAIADYGTEAQFDNDLDTIERFASRANEVAEFKQALQNELSKVQ